MRLVPASTHLAWSMLVRNPRRFLGGLAAITLSTLAVFVCLGFYTGLNDSQGRITTLLNGDLVVFNARTNSVTRFEDFFRTEIYRLLALDGVAEVVPIHQGSIEIRNPETEMYKSIQYIAFRPESRPFQLPELEQNPTRLSHPGNIIYDSLSRKHFGPIESGMVVEIQGQPARIVDTTRYGPNFSRHGTVFMDPATLEVRLGMPRGHRISLALIRAEPGVDLAVLKGRVRGSLRASPHLEICTPDELYLRELLYTLRLTPAGAILALGLFVALVVGCVISYQILFTEITDHLPQFATCKAMGFGAGFLKRVVLQEALLLSVLGFPLGILATLQVYAFIEHATNTIMLLTPIRVAVGFALTLLMCSLASRVAVQRAIATDPADLF